MDVLLDPGSVNFSIARWGSLGIFLVAFVLLAARLLSRLLTLDRTGWETEIEKDYEYRRYWVHQGDDAGGPGLLVPKRVWRAVLRGYAGTWLGALHLGLVAVSGLVAIALSMIANS